MRHHRPTQVTVDLDAIVHNLRVARRHAGTAAICAVVKANAYGHGAIEVSRALAAEGVDWLGVALVEEGVALREAGVATPILVWGGALHDAYDVVLAQRLTPVVSRPEQMIELSRAAGSAGAAVHVEVDSGMARLGVPQSELGDLLACLHRCGNLRLDGLMSHMAVADRPNDPFNALQYQRFAAACADAEASGNDVRWRHLANSPATLSLPATRAGLVRCGLLLYGLEPMQQAITPNLRPALRWSTRILAVRDLPENTPVSYGCRFVTARPSRIATLAVGYADGYTRRLHGAHVLIRGQAAPICGTICMDLCMVDVTDIPGAGVDDEAVLVGPSGARQVTVDDLALWSNTISYEVVCGIGARVPRAYVGGAA